MHNLCGFFYFLFSSNLMQERIQIIGNNLQDKGNALFKYQNDFYFGVHMLQLKENGFERIVCCDTKIRYNRKRSSLVFANSLNCTNRKCARFMTVLEY